MVSAQAHRGPDGTGIQHLIWTKEEVWLGHNLLSISGTASLSRQPMRSPDGRCGIIFNGEIYNAAFLKSQLLLEGDSFLGDSDTEVLLAWVRRFGRKGLSRLEGMYAFVFWDSEKELLLMHRDHYGIKPLFYAESNEYLLAASEPAGLFAAGLIDFQPDFNAIPSFLNYKFIPAPHTAWQGLHCLHPGECMEYRGSNSVHHRTKSLPEVRLGGFRQALDEAFSAVIPASQPFGLALSGGIDSGLILSWCLQRNLRPELYSIRFPLDSPGYSDTRAVEKMALRFKLSIHWIENDASDFEEITSCRHPWEALVADSALVLSRKIAHAAKENGLKILLSGAGADEWFGGYRRHAFFRQWLSLEGNIPEDLKRWVISAVRPGKLRWMKWDFGQLEGMWQSAVSSCLNSSLKNLSPVPLPDDATAPLENMLRWDQQSYLPQDVLWITDLAGMAEGVEARFPFLHPSLTDFADDLPLSKRMGRGRKQMLRDEFRLFFGDELAERKKQGFGIAEPAFLRNEQMKKRLESWLDQLNQKLPPGFMDENWLDFQKEALKKPGKYLQEWISLGRLNSWLASFPSEKL